MKKYLNIAFVVVAVLTILEFLFIQGLFTSFTAMAAVCVAGLVNIIFAVKDKKYNELALYLIASASLILMYTPLL